MNIKDLFHFCVHLHLSASHDQWLRQIISTSLIPRPIQNVKDELDNDWGDLSTELPFVLELHKDSDSYLIAYDTWKLSTKMWTGWKINRAWQTGLAYLTNSRPPYLHSTPSGLLSPLNSLSSFLHRSLGEGTQINTSVGHQYEQLVVSQNSSTIIFLYGIDSLLVASLSGNGDYGFCIAENYESEDYVCRVAFGSAEQPLDVTSALHREQSLVRPSPSDWASCSSYSDGRLHRIMMSGAYKSSATIDSGFLNFSQSKISLSGSSYFL